MKSQRPTGMTKRDEWISRISAEIPGSYYALIRREIGNGPQKILDVGCGTGSFMFIAAKNRSYDITGVDIFGPSVQSAKGTGAYTKLIRQDIRSMKFKDKSFDTVVSIQVLEHLPKNDGLKLLKGLERLAKKKIVIVLPVGECEQHAHGGNKYQEHLSEWYPEDFKKLGYRVYGQGLNAYHRIPWVKSLLSHLGPLNHFVFVFHVLLQPVIARRFDLALHIICVKDLS